MGNNLPGISRQPERALVVSYAPAHARRGLAALFALDDRLASFVRAAREPLIGQMRLTWWHDALCALDRSAPPPEEVLGALAADVIPYGVAGETLAGMIDGWELLLGTDPLSDEELAIYARMRGGILFAAIGLICQAAPGDPVAAAGEGWALVDLACNVRDPLLATRARALASDRLATATAGRWSRRGRALGALAHLARHGEGAGPGMVARLLFHRLTGR